MCRNEGSGCYDNFIIMIIIINSNVSVMLIIIMTIKVISMKVTNCKNAEKIRIKQHLLIFSPHMVVIDTLILHMNTLMN